MNNTGGSIEEGSPKLLWEIGTAYDLFISLLVLHEPEDYGLRGSWAAGVRSRLPAGERKVLEDAIQLFHIPLQWLHALPEPKDSATALWTLGQLPPAERLPALALHWEMSAELRQTLLGVAARRAWDDRDMEEVRGVLEYKKAHLSPKEVARLLDCWAQPAEFGELFLQALSSYQQVFYAEEERRILPVLRDAVGRAQELARRLPVPDLLAELSQGVHFNFLPDLSELVLTPSFWSTPLVNFDMVAERRMVMTFGARPAGASLVPGEEVPDAMLQTLKALADPTRLRIMRYLAAEPMTPAQLSKKLRLRAPTVVHHLYALRMAGLVIVNVETSGEKRYAIRAEMLTSTLANIQEFLKEDSTSKATGN